MRPVLLSFRGHNETPETDSYKLEAHYIVILKPEPKLHGTDYMHSRTHLFLSFLQQPPPLSSSLSLLDLIIALIHP